MALSDHEPTNSHRIGPRCPIGILLTQIDPADGKTIEGWIDNRSHYGSVVAESINAAIKAGDIVCDMTEVSTEAVRRHRKRHEGGDHCKCP